MKGAQKGGPSAATHINRSERSGSVSPIDPPSSVPSPAPTLEMLHRVETLLREACADDEGPLPFDEILARSGIEHPQAVRICVEELKRFHLVSEDPQAGVMWTLHGDPAFWNTAGTVSL